jgi:hypothetical protein
LIPRERPLERSQEAPRLFAGTLPLKYRTKEIQMKALLIAGMLAIGGVAFAGAPAQAASVTITTNNGYHHHYGWRHDHWRHHHRHCWTKVRKYWHHGHRVVRRVRVCER